MTEEERAERLRRLQERRGVSGAAPSPKELEDTQPIEVDQSAALRSERSVTAERLDPTLSGWSSRLQPTGATPRPRRPRKSHKAEASRIASAGAGIALTFTLMSAMAQADGSSAVTNAPDGPEGTVPPDTAATPTLGSVSSTAPVSSIVAATPQGSVPVILTPVQVRTRVIRAAGGSFGGSSAGGSSGGAPGGSSGGSSGGGGGVQAPPPPPPPPSPPTTQSNGSG